MEYVKAAEIKCVCGNIVILNEKSAVNVIDCICRRVYQMAIPLKSVVNRG